MLVVQAQPQGHGLVQDRVPDEGALMPQVLDSPPPSPPPPHTALQVTAVDTRYGLMKDELTQALVAIAKGRRCPSEYSTQYNHRTNKSSVN